MYLRVRVGRVARNAYTWKYVHQVSPSRAVQDFRIAPPPPFLRRTRVVSELASMFSVKVQVICLPSSYPTCTETPFLPCPLFPPSKIHLVVVVLRCPARHVHFCGGVDGVWFDAWEEGRERKGKDRTGEDRKYRKEQDMIGKDRK